MYFVCHAIFYKASFKLSRCTPRCVPAVCSRLCPGHRRQSPGVTTASPGSKTTKPRCGTVAYAYQWNFCELIIDMSLAKYRTQVTYQGKNNSIRVGEKVGNGISNDNLPANPLLSLVMKLFRIIQLTWVKLQQTWFKYCFCSSIGVHRLEP